MKEKMFYTIFYYFPESQECADIMTALEGDGSMSQK